jgi:hypothetical protein
MYIAVNVVESHISQKTSEMWGTRPLLREREVLVLFLCGSRNPQVGSQLFLVAPASVSHANPPGVHNPQRSLFSSSCSPASRALPLIGTLTAEGHGRQGQLVIAGEAAAAELTPPIRHVLSRQEIASRISLSHRTMARVVQVFHARGTPRP